ncbi:MAG: hypothetical protein JXA94_02005 [Parachlamydiales bacterium]|nr:hypothetical protein [Parachlamydiales bacterium]
MATIKASLQKILSQAGLDKLGPQINPLNNKVTKAAAPAVKALAQYIKNTGNIGLYNPGLAAGKIFTGFASAISG